MINLIQINKAENAGLEKTNYLGASTLDGRFIFPLEICLIKSSICESFLVCGCARPHGQGFKNTSKIALHYIRVLRFSNCCAVD